MLDLFRKRGLSSIVYGVIIVATILVFVIQFRPNAGQKSASLSQACVATVRGSCIDPKDHKAAYRILIPRDGQGGLMTARAKQMGLLRIALDGLVERELLVTEAERLGLTVTEAEIIDELYDGYIHVSVPSDNPQLGFQLRVGDGRIYAGFRDPKTKQFDLKVYERSVRNLTGRSAPEFRDEQARELLASKMRDLVRAPVRVSEVEALESYVAEKSSATVMYVPVKQSFVARYGVAVNDADVDKWAAEKDNAKAIADLVEQRKADATPKPNHVRHILIKVEPSATADAKAAALARLSEAVQRVKRGAAFADVAREVSQDTGSAAKGGDVGDKTDGFVAPFKKAADALKPGEMTAAAIETQFGYHAILKDDPAKAADLEPVLKKDAARELYTKAKSVDVAKGIAQKILGDAKAGKTLDDAAKASLSMLKNGPTTVTLLPVEAEPPPAEAATDAGAPDGSAPDGGKPGAAASSPAAPKKPAVTTATISPDTDPDRPQAQTSNAVNKGGDPIPMLASEPSQKVTKFAFDGKPGDVMPEPLRTDDGFMVVVVKDRKTATREEFDKDRETYVQTLLAAKQAEALALYVKRLRETAKAEIKINEAYLEEPGAKDGGAPMPEEEDEGF